MFPPGEKKKKSSLKKFFKEVNSRHTNKRQISHITINSLFSNNALKSLRCDQVKSQVTVGFCLICVWESSPPGAFKVKAF